MVHTAPIPTIVEVDTVYINFISNCTHFKAYSFICIYLLYAVRSAVWLLILLLA